MEKFTNIVHQLPPQLASFVGRRDELSRITDLMADPACRLLTLVGPGGIGKTRLAVEAAQRLQDWLHFVPLQATTAPDFLVSAIADALGFQFYPGDDPKHQLLDYLCEKSWLLVLDNFEHLLDGAMLLSDILAYAPDVRLLVTSRERLNLTEEWVLEVGGLTYPTSENDADAERYSAVELFMKHARRINTGFTLTDMSRPAVNRICRLVGGMPLGIELAASWVRALSPEAIADEIGRSLDILETPIRNVEPRHRTMRAAFDPTWMRLPEGERNVFMRLSVFRGGITREAAESVAGASLRILSALVDKSLLRVSADGRYDMHQLLRQYGEEHLKESVEGLMQIRDGHCHYYMKFLAQCWPRLTGRQIKSAMTDIDIELDNVRTAWNWALRQQKVADIEASLDSLWFFYDERARYQEGEQAFAKAAAVFSGNAFDAVRIRAKIQVRQGALCYNAGLSEKGESLLQQTVILFRHIGARDDLAFALHRLAIVLLEATLAFSEAAEYLQESLALFTELDDRWRMAHVLNWLSIFHHRESSKRHVNGALERAESCAWECLSLYQQLDSLWGMAAAYLNLGDVAHLRGEYEKCKQYTQKSLSLFREIGSFWGISISLMLLGEDACQQGAYTEAKLCAAQGLQASFDYRLTSINFYSLHHLTLAVQIWLGEQETERAYELMGLLDQQRQKLPLSQRKHGAFAVLPRLEEDLSPSLAAAVERGRAWNADEVVNDIIVEFSRSVESSATLSALTVYPPLMKPLTKRELEVLRLVTEGLNNRDIAVRLFLAPGTVKWYLGEIYSKLGVNGRMQAVARARELHLLD